MTDIARKSNKPQIITCLHSFKFCNNAPEVENVSNF